MWLRWQVLLLALLCLLTAAAHLLQALLLALLRLLLAAVHLMWLLLPVRLLVL